MDAREQWPGGDPERLAQLIADTGDQRRVVGLEGALVQRAADEAPQQRTALGRASRILHARERAREHDAPLGARHHETEAVERVGDVAAPVAERDRRRRGVGDLTEQRGERRIHVAQQSSGRMPFGCDDDAIGLERRAVVGRDTPALASSLDPAHALLETNGARWKP